MATGKASPKLHPVIRIEVDGEKVGRLGIAYSSTAAELRTILSQRYKDKVSSNVDFLDANGYCVHTEDEQSVTISDLITGEHCIIKLKTNQNRVIPEIEI